jgi:hypothetical protein
MPSFSWRHNHLHVQRDFDFVPDHESSIVECWAVLKTEILMVDFCGSGYRSPLQSSRILDRRRARGLSRSGTRSVSTTGSFYPQAIARTSDAFFMTFFQPPSIESK